MLETTIDAQPDGDAVAFTLRVENRGDEAVELSFSDSQRVRVSVYPADVTDGAGDNAEPIWRSEEGQMFMQVLGSETMPAGESIEFREEWESPDSGPFRAVGEIVSRDQELRDETTFSV